MIYIEKIFLWKNNINKMKIFKEKVWVYCKINFLKLIYSFKMKH